MDEVIDEAKHLQMKQWPENEREQEKLTTEEQIVPESMGRAWEPHRPPDGSEVVDEARHLQMKK